MGLDIEIRYKSERENMTADAISRRMADVALSVVQFSELEEWEEAQSHSKLKTTIQYLIRFHYPPGVLFQNRIDVLTKQY